MISYSRRSIYIFSDAFALSAAESAVDALPDETDPEGLRCHEVARIVARFLMAAGIVGPVVVDGQYGAVEHSWIVLRKKIILDPYVVASLPQVRLVDPREVATGLGRLYREGPPRADIREAVVEQGYARISRNVDAAHAQACRG